MEHAFGLTDDELKLMRSLNTPMKVQDFLDTLAINHEKDGETCVSPRAVMESGKAHCFEAASFAASVFWLQGGRPLLMECRAARGDQDHSVALYKVNGYWGAVSKTNHISLRFRDPIYKTIRELALSYFHEYFINETGTKSMRSYTLPFSLARYGRDWVTSEKEIWHIAYDLHDAPHLPIIPPGNEGYIRKADQMERKGGTLIEWPQTDPRT